MNFKYQAMDQQGREINGVLEALNEREAARLLQKRELQVLRLYAAGHVEAVGKVGGKPRRRDLLLVMHELAVLLESDIALIEAVESLAESSHHPALVQAFADIAKDLRHGGSFSESLRRSSLELPEYILQLAQAGEMTGKPAQALRQGVEQMEYDARVITEMRNALIYPSILVCSGIAAVLLVFTVVVPRFAGALKSKGDELPLLSKAVLQTGLFLNEYILAIGVLFALLAGAAWSLLKAPEKRAVLLQSLLRVPLLGEWILEAETGRWAAMLGVLLDNRVPLLRALELSAQGVRAPRLRAQLEQVGKAVRGGSTLSQALRDNNALSGSGHNLIRAGEKAGELPKMLKSLARLFEDSGRTRMKRFLLLLEPAAILLIGAIVGLIITGVIMTITSVNQIAL